MARRGRQSLKKARELKSRACGRSAEGARKESAEGNFMFCSRLDSIGLSGWVAGGGQEVPSCRIQCGRNSTTFKVRKETRKTLGRATGRFCGLKPGGPFGSKAEALVSTLPLRPAIGARLGPNDSRRRGPVIKNADVRKECGRGAEGKCGRK